MRVARLAPTSKATKSGNWWRRVAVVALLALGIGLAIPPGTLPPNGDFPLGWLWHALAQRPAWAGQAFAGLPVQHDALGVPSDPVVPPARAERDVRKAPADPTTTPDLAKKDRFDPATSVLVPERSTAKSDVYRNKDGSYTAVASTQAVNFKAADGAWRKIDLKVVSKPDGRLRPAATGLDVSLAKKATASKAKNSALATIVSPKGPAVGFGLQGAAAVDAVVTDSVATYPGVLPGHRPAARADLDRVKETIVLSRAAAVNSWVFPLTLDGVTAKMDKSGSIDPDRRHRYRGRHDPGRLHAGLQVRSRPRRDDHVAGRHLRTDHCGRWAGAAGHRRPGLAGRPGAGLPGADRPLDRVVPRQRRRLRRQRVDRPVAAERK
jgi:hypothetical protein